MPKRFGARNRAPRTQALAAGLLLLSACRSPLGAARAVEDPGAAPFVEDCLDALLREDLDARTRQLCSTVVRVSAPRVAGELCERLSDPRLDAELAVSLVEVLDHPGLADDPRVGAVLLDLSRSPESGAAGDAAVRVALETAGPRAADWLHESYATLGGNDRRARALAALLEQDPGGLQALLPELVAPDLDDEGLLVLLDFADEPAVELAVIEAARTRETEGRRAAARRLAGVQGDEAEALRAGWLATEPDAGVAAALAVRPPQGEDWTTFRALGAPDADPAEDDPRAWTYRTRRSGEHWLEVGFPSAMPWDTLRIWEVNAAGGIRTVIGRPLDDPEAEQVLWEDDGAARRPGMLEIRREGAGPPLKSVRIVIDSNRSNTWFEIDAVQLSGPEGSMWANSANASSSYGGE